MGKHARVKASAKDKRRTLPTDAPAVLPVMEESPVSRLPETAAPDAAPSMKRDVGEGRKVAAVKTASNGGLSSPTLAEEIQHLRTLNGILAKQMVEARQERDLDRVVLSEIEGAAISAALVSQLSEEARRLTHAAGEKGRADGAVAAGREAAKRMAERLEETESKWMGVLKEIERKKAGVEDENVRLTRDLRELAEEKMKVENKLRTAEAEADAINRTLQDARRELKEAQKENHRCKTDLQRLVHERDEARKHLGMQTEERNALEMKISNLEERYEEINHALDLAQSRCRAMEEELTEREAALTLLKEENASLDKSLLESLRIRESLSRKLEEVVSSENEEVNQLLLERNNDRECLRLKMREMESLATMARVSAEEVLRCALSECQPSEDTTADLRGDLESLKVECAASDPKNFLGNTFQFLNKLMRGIAKDAHNKGEELERTREEMEKAMFIKEAECAGLLKDSSSFRLQLAALRDEHESVKAERDGLRSQAAELSASNGDFQKMLETMRAELKKQAREKEEDARSYQSQVEGYLQNIEDLTRKLGAAAVEKEIMEKEKGVQEDEISGLKEVVANLISELAACKELSVGHARENVVLRAERDSIQERLGQQTQMYDDLAQRFEGLEKGKMVTEGKLGELQRVNSQLLGEKEMVERQVDSLTGEKASLETSLTVAEGRLENAEKKLEALQNLTGEALALMKNVAAEATRHRYGRGVEGGEREETDGEVAKVGDVRPFAVEAGVIKRALRGREEEMEEMKREMARHLESVEGVRKANASWKWISSAMAAVSTTALAWAFTIARRF